MGEINVAMIVGVACSLVALVLALAFLLASAPARHSDLWLHLATGRALADGAWRFGPDPPANPRTVDARRDISGCDDQLGRRRRRERAIPMR